MENDGINFEEFEWDDIEDILFDIEKKKPRVAWAIRLRVFYGRTWKLIAEVLGVSIERARQLGQQGLRIIIRKRRIQEGEQQ